MQERPSRDIEPANYPDFSHTGLTKHAGLQKHKSSLLVQIQTGKIGLRAFLHSRRVPGVSSPCCECGAGRETALHLILECRDTASQRWDLMEALGAATPIDRSSLAEAMKNSTTGGEIVWWLLRLGRLREFRLAIRLAQDSSAVEDVERERLRCAGAPQQGRGDSDPGLTPIVNSKPLPSYLALHWHSRSKMEGIVAVAASE